VCDCTTQEEFQFDWLGTNMYAVKASIGKGLVY